MACCTSQSHAHSHSHQIGAADVDFLAALIAQPVGHHQNRRPVMDPILLQAAAASGPHVTRNHYLHDYYPHANPYQRCDVIEEAAPARPRYVSKQAPRQVRLAKEKDDLSVPMTAVARRRRSSASLQQAPGELMKTLRASAESAPDSVNGSPTHAFRTIDLPASEAVPPPLPTQLPVAVTCHVRTRVPTPHGNAFVHLYKNTHDEKEHMAFVIDKAQLNGQDDSQWIRSRSLDAVWREGETDDERIVRGAYVGRLAPGHAVPSEPAAPEASTSKSFSLDPLVRIHSECFTGETIGSQRCDCGEQLDEAFRLASTCPSGRGVIVYLRQEGRGIGLLEKLRAYNLQDLGHDTVTANLLLGHRADTRTYDVAGAILRDLGIERCRLMTNNPDKLKQAEREGIQVSERVAMVPRTWRAARRPVRTAQRPRRGSGTTDEDDGSADENAAIMRRMGVGMIGAGDTAGPELDKYLRTKVLRMSHMIDLPSEGPPSSTASTSDHHPDTPPSDSAATKPSTAAPSQITPKKLRRPRIERLANSVDSLAMTDPEGLDCGESCCQGDDDSE